MRCFLKLLACLPILAFALSAHADIVSTYEVSGGLTDGGTFSGTFTIDFGQYGNSITAFDITTTGGTNGDAGTFDGFAGETGFGNNKTESTLYAQMENGSPAPFFYLLVTPDGDGYSVCTTVSTCEDGSYTLVTNSLNYIDSIDSANQVTVTPEPSSLLLLGTGILGVAGAARRRFLNA